MCVCVYVCVCVCVCGVHVLRVYVICEIRELGISPHNQIRYPGRLGCNCSNVNKGSWMRTQHGGKIS